MQAVSRDSGQGRQFRYNCSTYWNKGATVCANNRQIDMREADTAVQDLLRKVLTPQRIEAAIDRALVLLAEGRSEATERRHAIEVQITKVERELANLTDTAARSGAVPAVLAALADREERRRELTRTIGDRRFRADARPS